MIHKTTYFNSIGSWKHFGTLYGLNHRILCFEHRHRRRRRRLRCHRPHQPRIEAVAATRRRRALDMAHRDDLFLSWRHYYWCLRKL